MDWLNKVSPLFAKLAPILASGASLYSLYQGYQSSNRESKAEERVRQQREKFESIENQLKETKRSLENKFEEKQQELLRQNSSGNSTALELQKAQLEFLRQSSCDNLLFTELRETQRELIRQSSSKDAAIAELQKQIEKLSSRLERLVEPKCLPTHAEIESARRRLKYESGFFHIAVAGCSGHGKSSIINALRVLKDFEPGAAPVGCNETTAEITRYPPVDPKSKIVLYDIPGAGTLKVPRWEYFKSHLLYAFDAIILSWATRLYDTDMAILQHAVNLNIRCFVVRSKCDQDLKSIRDNIEDLLEDEKIFSGNPRYQQEFEARCYDAVKCFRSDSQNVLDDHCKKEDLPRQKLFLVNKRCLYGVARGSRDGQVRVSREDADNFLDEESFIQEVAGWVISESEVVNECVGVGDRGSTTATNETQAITSGQAAFATQDSDEKKTVDAPTATGCHVLLPSQLSAESLKAKRLDLQRLATTVTPSAAKLAYIAVVGSTGAGKSSLINSMRGLRKGAAPLEAFNCEHSRSLAVFPGAGLPVIYFEVPGFENVDCLPEEFFTAQSLYAFDVVVLVWESGLADTEVSIIGSCLSWGIPIMLVRNKSDCDLLSEICYAAGEINLEELKETFRRWMEQVLVIRLTGVPGYSLNNQMSQLESFILNESSLGGVVRGERDESGMKMDEEEFLRKLQHYCDIKRSARQTIYIKESLSTLS